MEELSNALIEENNVENQPASKTSQFTSDPDIDIQRWSQKFHGEIMNFMAQREEKSIFIWSVLNLCISCYAIGGNWFSGLLPWYYSIKFPIMIIARYVMYKKLSWQWFLLDFCYFGNIILLVFLWIYPNKQLFCMVFAVTNGPLLWAIMVFGNQFVFHSLDKATSLMIHITPAIITYIIRWQYDILSYWDINDRWTQNICITDNEYNEYANWRNMVFYPFLFAVAHQILYYILVQFVFYDKIVSDSNSWTTYRYLFRESQQKGAMWNLINICGKRGRIFVFGALWIIYATICFLPTLVLYRFQWMQFGLIVVCLVYAINNGAEFYGKMLSKQTIAKGKEEYE